MPPPVIVKLEVPVKPACTFVFRSRAEVLTDNKLPSPLAAIPFTVATASLPATRMSVVMLPIAAVPA